MGRHTATSSVLLSGDESACFHYKSSCQNQFSSNVDKQKCIKAVECGSSGWERAKDSGDTGTR